MLAEANPNPTFVYQFILTIGLFLSMAANMVAVLALNRKQKREVTFGFEPASKAEFDKHTAWDCAEHDKFWSKIGGMERGQAEKLDRKFGELSKEANEGREKLHNRINVILKAIARIEGRMGVKSGDEEGS